ncbi:hypothetical protein LSH36_722g00029 [Paralvinella palmiformis]|uniref:AP-3 complex subunit beta n=1 Tax=Paralvinella palmiformis TaxID=53620 RepID=A0AAD9MVU5_9ANNE|nr:hypothetical protein LSH36_722g00029 [Paralvinella palmiformis]
MANNGFQGSYANERPPSSTGSGGDNDVSSDPASSSFFVNDYKKHEDLKQMLDSSKDSLKLEAMKRIIGMIAKGRDASDLFPAVVKNVVSKNIEVKKLVYVYLTRYAEERQDLALLSISTFQRALKDPNQLIRASALRVLSSIRVPMIVPIMMLAIKEAVMDMSPYVRKTAAHAIPKLYSLEPEQKEVLLEVIEKLLADKTTLVAGSAIEAFEEVCPERIDLIHKNYRKLCNLLVDVEEWGQVVIINMLTRYCRTQFVNPNQSNTLDENDEKAFYDSDEEVTREANNKTKKAYMMDPDHRLLLRTCKPLLNSRNASVVMAVAQLYHHCAPKNEVSVVARALIRLLRGHKEVQYIVLSNIATMSVQRKDMFEPFLKSFYVRSNDPIHVKLLKLEILTNLASEANISTILREFQTYVTSSDHEFAAATIQAIGRCASNISEITDACLNGLVALLANRNETVVGESVVVLKKLMQMRPTEHKDIIIHLAKLAETITVPMARASILWLIGEYSDRVPKIAPDVLRKMAKIFISEDDIVKLQILNLAAKLCITNSKQTKLLCQYVFNLAKYDQNYDIRDRVRFLRPLVLPGEKAGALSKHAKKIFLATKPAPVLSSKFKERDQYQLGTLSHVINTRATGYQELPDWPELAPDQSVRNVEVVMPWIDVKITKKRQDKKKSFYSESEPSGSGELSSDHESSSEDESATEDSSEETTSASSSSSTCDEDSGSSTESESHLSKSIKEKAKILDIMDVKVAVKNNAEDDEEESGSDESSEEESSEEDSSSEEEVIAVKRKQKPAKDHTSKKSHEETSDVAKRPSEILLDLDFGPTSMDSTPAITPGDVLTPNSSFQTSTDVKSKPNYNFTSPIVSPITSHELINKITGGGLSAFYRFTRTMSIFSPKMISVDITFTNHTERPMSGIRVGQKKLQSGMEIKEFPEIGVTDLITVPDIEFECKNSGPEKLVARMPGTCGFCLWATNLGGGASVTVLMDIDFNDTTQPAQFQICTHSKAFNVSITAPVGELLQPNTITENDFLKLQGKLTGMNEASASIDVPDGNNNADAICGCIHEVANIVQVSTSEENVYRFAGRTVATGSDVLITVRALDNKKIQAIVNCDKMVIGTMLLKELKTSLSKV